MVLVVLIVERQGVFVLVIQEGIMIVDGVLVLCYVDIVDYDLVDIFMVFLKSFYSWFFQILGVRGKYVYGFFKCVLCFIGIRVFGEEMFYQGLDSEVMGGKEMIILVFDWYDE